MTDKLSRWEQAIVKLIESTQDDESFNWELVRPDSYLPKNADTEGTMLYAEKDGKSLLLYRKAYYERSAPLASQLLGSKESVKVYRAELALFDKQTKTIPYSFPNSKLVEELYRAATFKASGIESFINDLLKD